MDIEIKVKVGEMEVNSNGSETWRDVIYERVYVISGTQRGLTESVIKESELIMRVIIRDLEIESALRESPTG